MPLQRRSGVGRPPPFCKFLGDPGFVPSLRTLIGLDFACVWGGGGRGRGSHGDPEAGSLFSQADSVCYLEFQEDEAFRESGLYSSECYLAC